MVNVFTVQYTNQASTSTIRLHAPAPKAHDSPPSGSDRLTSSILRSGFAPTTTFQPSATVSGHSVVSQSLMQGVFRM